MSRNAASKIRLVDLASGFDFDGIRRTIGCEWCDDGMENVNFAIGVISFVTFLGLFLFRAVLYTDEKRKR